MSASSAIFTDSSYQWSEIRETTADFVLPDITNGQLVKLSNYKGKQPILAFTRIFTEKQYCPYAFLTLKPQ